MDKSEITPMQLTGGHMVHTQMALLQLIESFNYLSVNETNEHRQQAAKLRSSYTDAAANEGKIINKRAGEVVVEILHTLRSLIEDIAVVKAGYGERVATATPLQLMALSDKIN